MSWVQVEEVCEHLNTQWHNVVMDFVKEHETKFFKWPASCGKHHSYDGGLIDHSWQTALTAYNIAWNYPQVNRHIVVAAAFLHDVGKLGCYDKNIVDDKWIKQRANALFHHIPLGYGMLLKHLDKYPEITQESKDNFLHCILAHHGRKEWSSPVEPSTPEALIVHSADMVDAYLASYNERGILRGSEM